MSSHSVSLQTQCILDKIWKLESLHEKYLGLYIHCSLKSDKMNKSSITKCNIDWIILVFGACITQTAMI